jgi:hypothetical protein
MMPGMEKLIADITAYAAATGVKPQTVLRAALGSGWSVWDAWVAGTSSPTLASVDRLRAYMAANPPPAPAPAPDGADEITGSLP